jgi:hypothetical protein
MDPELAVHRVAALSGISPCRLVLEAGLWRDHSSIDQDVTPV